MKSLVHSLRRVFKWLNSQVLGDKNYIPALPKKRCVKGNVLAALLDDVVCLGVLHETDVLPYSIRRFIFLSQSPYA